MFNSKPGRPSCQFQKVFEFFSWNHFHEKLFHGLLWNFDVTTYLPTTTLKFWKCAESRCRVFAIMVEKFKFPAVGYLPWPLPILQKIQIQKLHTKSRKKSAKLLLQSSISPVGLVLCHHLEIVFPQLSSSSQLSTKFVYYKIFSWV